MAVYRLTQPCSSAKDLFFGVETTLCLTEVKLHIAYLQCIRERLPLLSAADDVLNEKSCVILLQDLYGMRKITTYPPRYQSIDLQQNWINYSLHSNNFAEYLASIAVKDASLAMLNLMAEDIEEKIVALKVAGSLEYPHAVLELERLILVMRGERIPSSWEWQDMNNTPLDDKTFSSFPHPELIPFR